MGEYMTPGVYVETKDYVSQPNRSAESATGGFIGITCRGKKGTPILITSWSNFLSSFSQGLDSPFMANSDLAYAVYGFFQNGGSRCYIERVASDAAAKAVYDGTTINISAKDEGTWGNNLTIAITANAIDATTFDIVVKLSGETVENFTAMSNTSTSPNYWIDYIRKNSNYISPVSGTLSAKEGCAFVGGADGISDIADKNYTDALATFDHIEDISMLSIPGQTSTPVLTALLSYAETRGDLFAILDAPKTSTVESVCTLRRSLSGKYGALYFPYIQVSDPLSKIGKLRDCPTCGHVMGVYARTIKNRGCWKSPAGTECILKGAVSVVTQLSRGDTDSLNPVGVNSIIPKSNYGIVIWGSKTLSSDSDMLYVSDSLLDIMVRKSVYELTQPYVFEPNNSVLWTKVTATVEAYLDSLWRKGAFNGTKPSEAYYVKCDSELNTDETQKQGKLLCEVGYAKSKPAEFIIFRVSHEVNG